MTIAGAVILAAIAGALHYKHRVPRFVAWVLLLVGVGAAATITNLFGGFTGMNLFGVGVFTLIAIITGIFFFEEACKRNGLHRVRTPLIAVVFGVALMSASGSLFTTLQNAVQSGGANVDKAVTNNLNGK